jgi:hypothetical protein
MRIMWAGHMARMGEGSAQGFDGKARRKDTSRKTESYMKEWDQNGS